MRTPRTASLVAAGALLVLACASQSGFVAGKQDPAVQNALQTGRFELGCAGATANVLSSTYVPGKVEQAQFVIGVSGCDKRAMYSVSCSADNDTCSPAQAVKMDTGTATPPAPPAPKPAN
ncbi:MAG TPA: hypothetical protein VMT17_03095 [Anaeromyxobacteraceae bacterium]|nr:hypothetical protein [Anaeromyxobacteraceae bacterium]